MDRNQGDQGDQEINEELKGKENQGYSMEW
jgi:hypothetical protein